MWTVLPLNLSSLSSLPLFSLFILSLVTASGSLPKRILGFHGAVAYAGQKNAVFM
jgi:hypothetical protein